MSEMQHFPRVSYVSANFRCDICLDRFSRQFAEAQQWLGDRVLEDSKPFMPHVTGDLQQLSKVLAKGKEVLYPGPTARFLYMGKVMVGEVSGSAWAREGEKKVVTNKPLTYSSADATAFWFEAAKAENEDYWLNGVKRIAGGSNGRK